MKKKFLSGKNKKDFSFKSIKKIYVKIKKNKVWRFLNCHLKISGLGKQSLTKKIHLQMKIF